MTIDLPNKELTKEVFTLTKFVGNDFKETYRKVVEWLDVTC
jgi:hypothetical protein